MLARIAPCSLVTCSIVLKGLIKPDLNAQDSSERLAAIEKLSNPGEFQTELAERVKSDGVEAVRLAALGKMSDVEKLAGLIRALVDDSTEKPSGAVTNKLQKRFITVLQGTESGASPVGVEQQRALLAQDSAECRVLLACASTDANICEEALSATDSEEILARIVCEAQQHAVRLKAAERLQEPELMQRCANKVKNRDKVAARHLQQRLDDARREREQAEMHQASVRQITNSMKSLSESVWSPQDAGQFTSLSQRFAALTPSPTEAEQSTFQQHAEVAGKKVNEFKSQQEQLERCKLVVEELEGAVERVSKSSLETLAAEHQSARSVADHVPEAWKQAVEALTAENEYESRYKASKSKLDAILKPLGPILAAETGAAKGSAEAINKALADEAFAGEMQCAPELRDKLAALTQQVEKDKHRQTQLVEGLGKQLNAFSATIAAGNWGPAEGMSQRIARKLEQIDGSDKKSLQSRFDTQRKKLDELADWQDFAARPKLEALVQSMQELPGKSLKPRALADEVKALQNQWKELGNSRVANELWSGFKEAGDTAYAPCKEYFEGLKKQREARLKNRTAVCERLEAFVASSGVVLPPATESASEASADSSGASGEVEQADNDGTDAETTTEATTETTTESTAEELATPALQVPPDSPAADWKAMQRMLSEAHREWRNNRPGGKKPQKQLETRFATAVSQVEALIAPHFAAGETERREIIEKTRKLTENDINQHAINQAKRLQAAWKLCGPASRKEDRKLWTEFNELCGQIFGKHREDQRARYKASMAHVDRGREIVKTIRAMGKSASEQEEKTFSELQDEFRALPEFPEKVKKGLLRDFRAASEGFSNKRSSQGKKQEQKELVSLRGLADLCRQLESGELDYKDLDSVETKAAKPPEQTENETADEMATVDVADTDADADADPNTQVATETGTDEASPEAEVGENKEAAETESANEAQPGSEPGEKADQEPVSKEAAQPTQDTPSSTADDDLDHWPVAWQELAAAVPKPWLKRVLKRRDTAISMHKKGESPYNDENNHARRLHCIKLEIARDIETPADDKSLKMQYQLEQLQSGPDSALLETGKEMLRNYEVDWLCLPPASPDIAATLEQRFKKVLGGK